MSRALMCLPLQLDAHALQRRLLDIEHGDLRNASVDSIAWAIRDLIPAIGGFTVVVPAYEPGMKLYRAVKLNEKPSHVSRISYPPSHLVTSYGRLNRPGQPIFYCSTHTDPPFFELGLKPGDLRCAVNLGDGRNAPLEPSRILRREFQPGQCESRITKLACSRTRDRL